MQEQQLKDAPQISPAGATVFVVDDDAAVRRSLTRLLRSAGWNVQAFASASHLLEQAPCAGPGCLLLDVDMPGMNGLELHERMSESGIGLPVVFLTGKGDVPMSVRAMKHGAVDFLVKPVEQEVLIQALSQAIRLHALQVTAQHGRDGIMARLARLSEREREVLAGVLQGRMNKQIATELGITEKTVKVHRARVMEKMEADSLAQLVHLCDLAGIEFPQTPH